MLAWRILIFMTMHSFPCTQCGLCCQKVGLAEETRFLDRGDGICKNYDSISRACQIYVDRPDICRIDRQYVLNYAKEMSWSEFIDINIKVCHQLQSAEILKQ